jgi:hypothetical protein
MVLSSAKNEVAGAKKKRSKGEEDRLPPTPPPCGNHLFAQRVARNLYFINHLKFLHSNSSVTSNPVFCPFFGQKGRLLGQKWPFFDPQKARIPHI